MQRETTLGCTRGSYAQVPARRETPWLGHRPRWSTSFLTSNPRPSTDIRIDACQRPSMSQIFYTFRPSFVARGTNKRDVPIVLLCTDPSCLHSTSSSADRRRGPSLPESHAFARPAILFFYLPSFPLPQRDKACKLRTDYASAPTQHDSRCCPTTPLLSCLLVNVSPKGRYHAPNPFSPDLTAIFTRLTSRHAPPPPDLLSSLFSECVPRDTDSQHEVSMQCTLAINEDDESLNGPILRSLG